MEMSPLEHLLDEPKSPESAKAERLERERAKERLLAGYIDEVEKAEKDVAELGRTLDSLKSAGVEEEPNRSLYRKAYENVVQVNYHFTDLQEEIRDLSRDRETRAFNRRMAEVMLRFSARRSEAIGAELNRIYATHDIESKEAKDKGAVDEQRVMEALTELSMIESLVDGGKLDEAGLTSMWQQVAAIEQRTADLDYPGLPDRIRAAYDKLGDAQMLLRSKAVPVSARMHYERAKAQYAAVSHRLSEDQRRHFRSKLAAMTALVRQTEAEPTPPPPEPPSPSGGPLDTEKTKQAISLAIARAQTAAPAIGLAAMPRPSKRSIFGALAGSLKLK